MMGWASNLRDPPIHVQVILVPDQDQRHRSVPHQVNQLLVYHLIKFNIQNLLMYK